MKRILFILASALALSAAAFAQDGSKAKEVAAHFKPYGFISTFAPLDTRESVSGTEDLFYYLPKDIRLGADGKDLNASVSFRFAALTSRLGLDITGYEIGGWKVAAKIEGDFYAGLSGSTGTAQLCLRQAFVTMNKDIWNIKVGQAWHPMAADMPDLFSYNTGAPFGPFSRTPLASVDVKLGKMFSLTGAALWQMQYTSAGPEGASANYMKYSCVPEFYFGINARVGAGLIRLGVDVLSIKPRKDNGSVKVRDRITTVSPFLFAQYKFLGITAKLKTVYASAGEHLGLNGGYGVNSVAGDGFSYNYTPSRNWSSWVSLGYGKKFQYVLFAGYVRNFGTAKSLLSSDLYYFSKNSFSNIDRMWRVTPTFVYNMGKLAFGAEYEVTGVQYGDSKSMNLDNGLCDKNLHWVTNHRIQLLVKYTF